MLFVIDLLRFASRTPHTHSLGKHSKLFNLAANGMKHTGSRNYRTAHASRSLRPGLTILWARSQRRESGPADGQPQTHYAI